jgi:uncharacterized repeat protein (TIGR03803 family)
VFRVTTNGVLTTFMSFTPGGGTGPCGNLAAASDGFLYGTTSEGGGRGGGTVFRLSFPDYRLRMLPLSFACGDLFALVRFVGSPGEAYRLLRATNVFGPWETLGNSTVSTDGVGLWEELKQPSGGVFYRAATP